MTGGELDDDARVDSVNPRQSGVANTIAGIVAGSSVQAGTIHGGVHFHQPAPDPTMVVPRQLRPAPAHFTNRARELSELDQKLGDGHGRTGPALVVIAGPGGVGKSALALRWLHSGVDLFPDGQLYVDLGAAAGEPVLLASVLGRLLRAFGLGGERIPADGGEAAALWRSVTAGKRIAVLVDNAESAAQVRALLPTSPWSAVLVASRWRLAGLVMDGAAFVTLTPLETRAGAELLARTVGESRVAQEPEEVARLVDLCGGLPIALSIAGARLTMRPRWPVARVVGDLVDEQRRLSVLSAARDVSVDSVFDVSYDALSVPVARAYRLLGLYPGPGFRLDEAAAALGLTDDETAGPLDTLTDASLLDVDDDDRYRFHDLVRLHARGCAEREEPDAMRTDVVRRVLEHQLSVVVEADLEVMPQEWRLGPAYRRPAPAGTTMGTATAAAALDRLESDLPNLMAALRAGIEHGLDELVWQLCEAMWSLFLYRKHFPDWISAYRTGVEAARRCGDDAARSRMHHHLGLAFHNLRRSDEAVDEGMAALATARVAAHRRAESEALGLVGMANRARGRHDEAIEILRQGVELDQRAGLARNEALAHRRLGQALCDASRYDEAVEVLRRARDQAAALRDAHVESNTAVWLADAMTRTGRAAEAVDLLREAWATLSDSGAPQYLAQVLMVWGEAAERLGNLDVAKERLLEAWSLYDRIGAPHVARVHEALERVEARLAKS